MTREEYEEMMNDAHERLLSMPTVCTDDSMTAEEQHREEEKMRFHRTIALDNFHSYDLFYSKINTDE